MKAFSCKFLPSQLQEKYKVGCYILNTPLVKQAYLDMSVLCKISKLKFIGNFPVIHFKVEKKASSSWKRTLLPSRFKRQKENCNILGLISKNWN